MNNNIQSQVREQLIIREAIQDAEQRNYDPPHDSLVDHLFLNGKKEYEEQHTYKEAYREARKELQR